MSETKEENKVEKLDPEFKKKWIEALRSGKYKQANGMLYDYTIEGYCCLGVVCVIAGIDKINLVGKATIDEQLSKQFSELKPITGNAIENTCVGILTNMNDEERRNFNEIANYIEKEM